MINKDLPQQKPILLVDDNPINLKLLRVLLKAKGYEVISAISADRALEVLQTVLPSLILMDIQLPEMNGLQLTQLIKKNPIMKDVPIVAVTAYAMKGDKTNALAVGCDGYITKPINTRTFIEDINHYIKKT